MMSYRSPLHSDPTRSPAGDADGGVSGGGKPAALTPGRILLVEDDALLRTLMADELREVGHQVLEAATGDEAWRLVTASDPAGDIANDHSDELAADKRAQIRLVLTDIRMPGVLQGDELAARLTADFPAIAVIVMSGHAIGDRERFPHFLPKPFDIGQAIRLVNRLLAMQQEVARINAGPADPRAIPPSAGRENRVQDHALQPAAAQPAKMVAQDTAAQHTTAGDIAAEDTLGKDLTD